MFDPKNIQEAWQKPVDAYPAITQHLTLYEEKPEDDMIKVSSGRN